MARRVSHEALIAGLRSEGVSVVDIGRVSTPMVYFGTQALDAAGGVMITASHNPGAYNGLKVCARHAVPLFALAMLCVLTLSLVPRVAQYRAWQAEPDRYFSNGVPVSSSDSYLWFRYAEAYAPPLGAKR